MTLNFSEKSHIQPVADTGGESVSFIYPYCALWVLEKEAFNMVEDWSSVTDDDFQAMLLCNLAQCSNFSTTSESSVTCDFGGTTLVIAEETDLETGDSIINAYIGEAEYVVVDIVTGGTNTADLFGQIIESLTESIGE